MTPWMDSLAVLPSEPMLIAAVIAVAGSAYAVWRLVGVALRVLFFVVSFAIGFGVIYGFTELTGHPQAVWVSAIEGLGVAWALSIIRAKIARTVAALAVVGLSQVTGWFGLGKKAPEEPAKKPPAKASKPHSKVAKKS